MTASQAKLLKELKTRKNAHCGVHTFLVCCFKTLYGNEAVFYDEQPTLLCSLLNVFCSTDILNREPCTSANTMMQPAVSLQPENINV